MVLHYCVLKAEGRHIIAKKYYSMGLGAMSHKLCGHQAHLPGVAKLNLRELICKKVLSSVGQKSRSLYFSSFLYNQP
jgi:hypothetical protein